MFSRDFLFFLTKIANLISLLWALQVPASLRVALRGGIYCCPSLRDPLLLNDKLPQIPNYQSVRAGITKSQQAMI
jgi:hypothetical protein